MMKSDKKSIWKEKSPGNWKRDNVKDFSRCNEAEKSDFYSCPVSNCLGQLEPSDIKFRFICNTCGLIAGSGFGSLYAPAKPHKQ